MIPLLTSVIRAHPQWLRRADAPLSFLKVSTPSSGKEGDKGKVILFVFEDGEKMPTLCVKTVRTYAHAEIIRRNHANLNLLHEGSSADLFARPLHLHDDGEMIFCIESVCRGAAFLGSPREVALVVEKYCAWQEQLARTAQIDPATRLPILVQHGDLTPDNVLISSSHVHFIDYDYVGVSTLPGFDLFMFLSKLKPHGESLRALCERHFPLYFTCIGLEVTSYELLIPMYRLQELKRKQPATP